MPQLFSPSVTKIYSQPIPFAASRLHTHSLCFLMSSKVHFWIVTHSPTDMQLSSACQCSQSKLSSPTIAIKKKKAAAKS